MAEHGNSSLQVRVTNQSSLGFLAEPWVKVIYRRMSDSGAASPKSLLLSGWGWSRWSPQDNLRAVTQGRVSSPTDVVDYFCNLGDGPKKYCKFYELLEFSKFHELFEFLEALSFKKGHGVYLCSPAVTSRPCTWYLRNSDFQYQGSSTPHIWALQNLEHAISKEHVVKTHSKSRRQKQDMGEGKRRGGEGRGGREA